MTIKHTPGPWLRLPGAGIYALDENNEVNRFSARIDGGYTIYTRKQRDAGLNATTIEELEANARLMSAAPDLLEALEDALMHEGMGWELPIERMQAAIAKAQS